MSAYFIGKRLCIVSLDRVERNIEKVKRFLRKRRSRSERAEYHIDKYHYVAKRENAHYYKTYDTKNLVSGRIFYFHQYSTSSVILLMK